MKSSNKKSKSIVQIVVLSLFLAAVGLASPAFHASYLQKKVGRNSVFIRSPKGADQQGSATGFEVVAPSGKVYTLTNAHVCGLGKDGIVMIQEKKNSKRLLPKRIIEVWEDNDLCLVEGLEGYDGLDLADSWEIGEQNWAIGYPLGEAMNLSTGFLKESTKIEIPLPELLSSQCTGPQMRILKIPSFLGDLEICVISRRAIATNIPTFGGNSGSPMVNAWGHVTGVIFAANSRTAWGYSVPLSDVKEFLSAY